MDSPKFVETFRKNYPCPSNYYQIVRIDIGDYDLVQDLECPFGMDFFNTVDSRSKIANSFCTLGIQTMKMDIVALICFSNVPNVPAVSPDCWEYWIDWAYNLKLNASHTLFISYLAFDACETFTFFRPILHCAFFEFFCVNDILLYVPPNCTEFEWLEGAPQKVKHPSAARMPVFHLMKRDNYSYRYKFRRAAEEDNDDLIPLIDIFSKSFVSNYGRYYVSEIVRTPAHRQRNVFVCEYNDVIVGVIFTNDNVNYETLNMNFELECFQGLKSEEEYKNYLSEYSSLKVSRSIAITTSHNTEEVIRRDSYHEDLMQERDTLSTKTSVIEDDNDSDASSLFTIVSAKSESTSASGGTVESTDSDYFASNVLLDNMDLGTLNLGKSHRMKPEGKNVPPDHGREKIHTFSSRYWKMYNMREGNAFAIEILLAYPGHEDSIPRMLDLAFGVHLNRDYAVLTSPSHCPTTMFQKYFVNVSPQPDSFFPHDLYVVNKHSLYGSLTVKRANYLDKPDLEDMLYDLRFISDSEEIQELINTPHDAFVLYYQKTLFGYAIVRREDNLKYLMTHYNLKKWNIDGKWPEQHGRLVFFTYSPIFQNRWQFILSELHRLGDYKQIYYVVKPKANERIVAGILENLLLAEPYQKMVYNLNKLAETRPSPDVIREEPPYALFFSTTHHISTPRINVNTKIVVVGASVTGISFIMALVSKQNWRYKLTFTNLTLVTPHTFNVRTDELVEQIFMKQCYLTRDYITMYAFDAYVNVIYGTMTAIDRKEKRIVVNDSEYLHYDHLVLTVGEQYQIPTINSDVASPSAKSNDLPKNVYVVNTDVDAKFVINDVKRNASKKGHLIIYGYSVEVYSCMATLLTIGINGKNVRYVMPARDIPQSKSADYLQFNDHKIYNAIHEQIRMAGIEILTSYNLVKWHVDPKTNRIDSVTFESRHKILELPCTGLFCYGSRTVSKRTLNAIIKAGIVFDGKIVIDNECKTNDPCIYAAGSCTKYARRYYADHLAHEHFNPMEIGFRLAQTFKRMLTYEKYEDDEPIVLECKTSKSLVPTYKWPLVTVCKLPGDLHYLYVRKPGKPVPLIIRRETDDYGLIIKTGYLGNLETRGYFSLHLNEFDNVETMTCLAKQNIERFNLINLWGMHESMLNNLKARHKAGYIHDLYEYFEEPWATAIYHQTFKDLNKTFTKLLKQFSVEKGNSLIEDLIKIFASRITQLNEDELRVLFEKFTTSEYLVSIKKFLMDYLIDNMDILPMYAQPIVLKGILCEYDLQTSHFFSKK